VLASEFIDGRDRPVCRTCGKVVYFNPLPCVAAMLLRDKRFCLVKRNVEPGFGEWGLPAGFMEWGETPEAALRRELMEESGLECGPLRLLTVVSELIRPYGHVVILGYTADAEEGELSPGDDASDAEFFSFDDHPPIAFITHREILKQFLSSRGPTHETAPNH
jgi:ADP-ribose pyrophosphatase YjhB (NUDIX family)